MDIKITNDFSPVKIELTLTSENEIQDLYNILNHGAICGTTKYLNLGVIREKLIEVYPNARGNFRQFADDLERWFTRKF
jgi:hypothetical protein